MWPQVGIYLLAASPLHLSSSHDVFSVVLSSMTSGSSDDSNRRSHESCGQPSSSQKIKETETAVATVAPVPARYIVIVDFHEGDFQTEIDSWQRPSNPSGGEQGWASCSKEALDFETWWIPNTQQASGNRAAAVDFDESTRNPSWARDIAALDTSLDLEPLPFLGDTQQAWDDVPTGMIAMLLYRIFIDADLNCSPVGS